MFPLVVHQPASPSIWPAVPSLRRGLSTNPVDTPWCVCGEVQEMMCVVCESATLGMAWDSGDACDLSSTLCKYNMRKGDLFFLRWAMILRLEGEVSLERC